ARDLDRPVELDAAYEPAGNACHDRGGDEHGAEADEQPEPAASRLEVEKSERGALHRPSASARRTRPSRSSCLGVTATMRAPPAIAAASRVLSSSASLTSTS